MYADFNCIQLLDMMSNRAAKFYCCSSWNSVVWIVALCKTHRIKLPSIQFLSITYVQAPGNNDKKWVKDEQGSHIHSNHYWKGRWYDWVTAGDKSQDSRYLWWINDILVRLKGKVVWDKVREIIYISNGGFDTYTKGILMWGTEEWRRLIS